MTRWIKTFLITITFSLLWVASLQTAQSQASFTPEQQKEIEGIMKDYLLKNPEVLLEASQALQAKQRKAMEDKAKEAIDENAKALFESDSPTLGNPKGTITIVEFYDYQCIHCKNMVTVLDDLLKKDNNIQLVLKAFPIFGENSIYAAKAALASERQGKFAAFHDALLKSKKRLTKDQVDTLAENAGLDVEKMKKDIEDVAIDNALKNNLQLAQSIGILGTPAFIITTNPYNKDKTLFVPGALSEDTLMNIIQKVQA